MERATTMINVLNRIKRFNFKFNRSKYKQYKNHSFFIGISDTFKGLGLLYSADNPVYEDEWISLEFVFFYFRFRYRYVFRTLPRFFRYVYAVKLYLQIVYRELGPFEISAGNFVSDRLDSKTAWTVASVYG